MSIIDGGYHEKEGESPRRAAGPYRGLGQAGEAATQLPAKETVAASNRLFLVCSGIV